MRRTPARFLSAATALFGVSGAALGVSGCSRHTDHPAMLTIAPPTVAAQPADQDPLPDPQTLTEVMYRLADQAVPGAAKLALVKDATPSDAELFDRFAAELRDTGFVPISVTASDLRKSPAHPGDLLATVKIAGGGQAGDGQFALPMEFHRSGSGGWQLTRETAEMLLAFGNARAAVASSPP